MHTYCYLGGVGFILGLVNYSEGEDVFIFIMVNIIIHLLLHYPILTQVGSSCLMCWGTLATTMDVLALVGIYKGKKSLLLSWLLW